MDQRSSAMRQVCAPARRLLPPYSLRTLAPSCAYGLPTTQCALRLCPLLWPLPHASVRPSVRFATQARAYIGASSVTLDTQTWIDLNLESPGKRRPYRLSPPVVPHPDPHPRSAPEPASHPRSPQPPARACRTHDVDLQTSRSSVYASLSQLATKLHISPTGTRTACTLRSAPAYPATALRSPPRAPRARFSLASGCLCSALLCPAPGVPLRASLLLRPLRHTCPAGLHTGRKVPIVLSRSDSKYVYVVLYN